MNPLRKTVSRRRFLKTTACGAATLAGCTAFTSKETRPSRPNIIVIVTDDQRWDALGCAGNPIIQTPTMDRLAAGGVRFEYAFVTTPICAASRASIFTGTYERTHGYTFTKPPVIESLLRESYPWLLRRAGYRTGLVGKFGIKVPEGMEHEMFDTFEPSAYPYFKNEERHLTDLNVDRAIAFLRSGKRNEPFCLSLSFQAPHAEDNNPEQFVWPRTCDALYEGVTIPQPRSSDPAFFEAQPEFLRTSLNRTRWHWRFDTDRKYQKMVKGYYRMISGVDMALKRMIDELVRLEMDQNTVILLIGDNGYFLGERGYAGKWTMHDPSLRIPLILHDPRTKQGTVSREMVLNVDVAPTVLELAGLPVSEAMQGCSLLSTTGREEVFCEHLWDYPEIPQTEAVRTKQWKYIRYPGHPEFEELYDLTRDPYEERNLAGEQPALLLELGKRCDHHVERLSR